MSELREYIKKMCVYSKLAEKPVVGRHGDLKLVFIHGFPMTLRGFYLMASRAIFGGTLPLYSKLWNDMNGETKLLCQGLGHKLEEGREAHSVIEGIRAASGWNKESSTRTVGYQWDRDFLFKWVESVEEQIALLDGITLPGPRLQ
jgi:hypothetical protein